MNVGEMMPKKIAGFAIPADLMTKVVVTSKLKLCRVLVGLLEEGEICCDIASRA